MHGIQEAFAFGRPPPQQKRTVWKSVREWSGPCEPQCFQDALDGFCDRVSLAENIVATQKIASLEQQLQAYGQHAALMQQNPRQQMCCAQQHKVQMQFEVGRMAYERTSEHLRA